MSEKAPTYVYFLRPVGMDGPVKIGCSRVPDARLLALSKWSPFPLEIAASIPGDFKMEARFHALFLRHHSHHEWFRAAPEITVAIAAIAQGNFDTSSLPRGAHLHPVKSVRWSAYKKVTVSIARRLRPRRGQALSAEIEAVRERFWSAYIRNQQVSDRDIALLQSHLGRAEGERGAAA